VWVEQAASRRLGMNTRRAVTTLRCQVGCCLTPRSYETLTRELSLFARATLQPLATAAAARSCGCPSVTLASCIVQASGEEAEEAELQPEETSEAAKEAAKYVVDNYVREGMVVGMVRVCSTHPTRAEAASSPQTACGFDKCGRRLQRELSIAVLRGQEGGTDARAMLSRSSSSMEPNHPLGLRAT